MRKIAFIVCIVLMVSLFAACSSPRQDDKITVVLDWTPNTNHTGLYVALEKGYYSELGLEVALVQPPEDGSLPLVAGKKAQFGVSYQEALGPALSGDAPLPVTAIAAIISHNESGLLSLASTGIASPKDLEGKRFAAWSSPLVDAIMADIIAADGGSPDMVNMLPVTVTDIVAALSTDIDAVWVYYAWDGMAAINAGLDVRYYPLAQGNSALDFYTPILCANNDYLAENPEQTKKFMAATAKGYEYAAQNPAEAAEILLKHAPELDRALVEKSQQYLAEKYTADAPQWGYIDTARWTAFFDWMDENGLLDSAIGSGGFTNEYLPK